MFSISDPYSRPWLLPKAISGLSIPSSEALREATKTARYLLAKRPTVHYVSKLSSEERLDLQEFMESALLENVVGHTVRDSRERDQFPATMPHFSMLAEDYPDLHKNIYRPQWTWADIAKLFGSVSFAPLQEYWMVPEKNVNTAVARISPRCALLATGMSLNAVHSMLKSLELPSVLPYSQLYAAIKVQTYIGKEALRATGVVQELPTEISTGTRRKAIHEYAFRLPDVSDGGTTEANKPSTRPLNLNLMMMPSYGDDINPQYLSIAVDAASWLLHDLHDEWKRMEEQVRAEEVKEASNPKYRSHLDPDVRVMVYDGEGDPRVRINNHLQTIAQWTWDSEVPTFDEGTTPNPCSTRNWAWTPHTRFILSTAMEMVMTGAWNDLLRGLSRGGTLIHQLNCRLAVAMIRVMLRRRYRHSASAMDAPTLLGISMITGVSPIVFLNYYVDHYKRTGQELFTANDADMLRDLIEAEDVKGSGVNKILREEEKKILLAEIDDWAALHMNDGIKEDGLAVQIAAYDVDMQWESLLIEEYDLSRTTPKTED